MAMVTCPECKKVVSSESTSCVNCGFGINTWYIENKDKIEEQIKQDNKTFGIGCIVMIVIIIIIGIFIQSYGQSLKRSSSDGFCDLCDKRSKHTFQGSEFCDKHYEIALDWYIKEKQK